MKWLFSSRYDGSDSRYIDSVVCVFFETGVGQLTVGDRPYLLSVRLAGRRGWLNHVRRLLGVVLPVMKSALMTCVIFGFIATWNELLVALVFISDPAKMTIRLKRKAVE